MTDHPQAKLVTRIIRQGFKRHYSLFHKSTEQAKEFFEQGNWQALQHISEKRISFYDQRVTETVKRLREQLGIDSCDEVLWAQVRILYGQYLAFHPQAELAETYYNSVFSNLFHRRYYTNENIFIESALAKRLPAQKESVYSSYFPSIKGLKNTITDIMKKMDFDAQFVDLDNNIKQIINAFRRQSDHSGFETHQLRFDILKSVFYRNKAAYVVGRVVSPRGFQPFVVPILSNRAGQLFMDALITDPDQLAIIFSFTRAYFFVDAQVPSALVTFLRELIPHKTLAELYSSIGLYKQGKNEFYRELLNHLHTHDDQFIVTPGIKGMVMTVFTMPNFPYVFKVIKDKFGGTKTLTREGVKERYLLVKRHDRVGRMADTMEYSRVALPIDRLTDELLQELKETAPSLLEFDGDRVIINHLYAQRKMIPLNLYIDDAEPEEIEAAIYDYGLALKEMVSANIFPGDMLLKNFGLTRHKRVVFYDYDEVQYLSDMNFRQIPEPMTPEQEMASEPWYHVGPNDVFPEEFITFLSTDPKIRRLFKQMHPELFDVAYWHKAQESVLHGDIEDVFPYPQDQRFIRQAQADTKNQEASK
ncbi:Isocitrate dehydrogenase phosphatase/kinase [gamma proteobacterium IMCC2047]|nr:Isocitrate dehydrogenase phosphatase/kinase [gamma proteobacterium IMCC2047]